MSIIPSSVLPDHVLVALAKSELVRSGGAIYDSTGNTVAWLRETSISSVSLENFSQGMPSIYSELLGLLGPVTSILNIGATAAFGLATLSKLRDIEAAIGVNSEVICGKLDYAISKINELKWTIDIGFSYTLKSLSEIKQYQEIDILGVLNSASEAAWSLQFCEPGSYERKLRTERAFGDASNAAEKLLLHAERETFQAVEAIKNNSRSSYLSTDEKVLIALNRIRQTVLACSLTASIITETGDLKLAHNKLARDAEKLSKLLYQIGSAYFGSKSDYGAYIAVLKQGSSITTQHIGAWIERFSPELTGVNRLIDLFRERGLLFSSNNNSIQDYNQFMVFSGLLDGVYEDCERLKGHAVEYKTAALAGLDIHEYRKSLEINNIEDDKRYIFFINDEYGNEDERKIS